MHNLIPLLVAIPLGVALIIPLASRANPRLADVLGNLAFAFLFVSTFWLSGGEFVYHMGDWPTPIGIDLRVDALTTLMLMLINGLALVVGFYSVAYLQRFTSRAKYYMLLLLLVAGMNGVVITGDLFNLYVFMELAAIASYALVAFGGDHEDLEAAFKYAVLGCLSSAVILIGVGLVYGMTGTLNMSQLAGRFVETGSAAPLRFALGMFFCGFALKAALVPFHAWLPDAHPAAPAPISAMLSGIVIKAVGVYVLARLLFNVFGITEDLLLLLRWTGGITMVVGALLALGQWDIKRLFAYSSISQIGLIVLALGFGTTLGVVGALYHLVNHAVFKSLLFLNSGEVEIAAGTRDLREMHGLGQRIPVTAATCMIGSLSLAGIPPLNGFWSKLIIVIAGIQAGQLGWAVSVVVISIVTLAYLLKVQKDAFYSNAGSTTTTSLGADTGEQRSLEPLFMAVPMILLAIGCVALSLLAWSGLDNPILVGPGAEVVLKGIGIW